MGIRSIIESLRDAVRSVTPLTWPADSFTCPRDGVVVEPGDWMQEWGRRTREFDVLVTTFPSPAPGCLIRAELSIVILYRMDQDTDLLMSAMAEDGGSILSSVLYAPSTWGGASSIWQEAAPEVEQIDAPQGQPALMMLTIPLIVDYSESVAAPVYVPEIISFDPLGGQAARLTLRAVSRSGDVAKTPVTLALRHVQADTTASRPAFIPRTYDLTSPGWTVSGDTPTSITTDSRGVAVVDLYYAGEETGAKTCRISAGGVTVTASVTITGERKWVDKNNPASADVPAGGTQAAPWTTLVYALSQVADEDTAIVIPTAATYDEIGVCTITRQAGLVGLVDGIVINAPAAEEMRWSGTYPTPRIVRRIATSSGYADSSGTPSDMLFSGCVFDGGVFGLYARTGAVGTYVSGCTISGTTAALYDQSDYPIFYYGCTLTVEAVLIGYWATNSSSWRSRQNRFVLGAGWAIVVNALSQVTGADSTVESDWNTYVITGAELGFAYADGGATTFATFGDWQAATGLDGNSVTA